MNDRQLQQVKDQLPHGAEILRTYIGFEDGTTRIIVRLPQTQTETRYIASFEGGYVKLEHRP